MTMKVRKKPNSEQAAAIMHSGGKILSAGAGSGKTFVLIEHIVHLLLDFKRSVPKGEWQQKIPFKLSKIVLMTFTKKAAGEMSIRMLKKVDEMYEDSLENLDDQDSQVYWEIIKNHLSMLNIMTIHSFCHKLISLGYFPELGANVDILSKIEQKNKIATLFNNWFSSRKTGLSQVVQANSTALITAMGEIFASPELRLMWKEPVAKTSAEEELTPFLAKMVAENEFETLFSGDYQINLGFDDKTKQKDWYKLYASFYYLVQELGAFSAKNFKAYSTWCDSAGKMHMTPKNLETDDKAYFDKSKEFIKEIRKYSEDFNNFIDHYDVYWQWFLTIKDAYTFIDKYFLTQKGFSFSDLEYYVCQGLRAPEIREAIGKNYDYFIVDEFQDTSSVQFEILQHLINQNMSKLFCVGDRKQAIYGFRGGELQVFSQCLGMMGEKNSLHLLNNFRSLPEIIKFNNSFFEVVFPLGIDFEGQDPHGIGMDKQAVMERAGSPGEVIKTNASVTNIDIDSIGDEKLNADFYEARALRNLIRDLLLRDDIQTICILYSRLKPSSYLLDLLSSSSISFIAQVKIAYEDDPVINLFLLFNELILNKNEESKLKATHYLLSLLLEAVEINGDIESIQSDFLGDVSIIGLRLAFHKMIFSLGISNSYYQENSKLIDSICKVCQEDPVRVYSLLSSEGADNYSLDLISGNDKKRIRIMSAHASKGLEFDAVLLGGIHTNGQQMPNRDLIGKLPKSFKWKKAYNQKTFYRSPASYEEIQLGKLKDFSESKRLLYVACTRAVKYLGWVELEAVLDGKVVHLDKNDKSWIKAFRLAEEAGIGFYSQQKMDLPYETFKTNEASLVLKDSLGLLPIPVAGKMGVFAETSVTRLAQLADCPFKFYLSTICKIAPPKAIPLTLAQSLDWQEENEEENEEESNDEEVIQYSSMKRGSEIHKTISELILGESSLQEISPDKRAAYQWVLDEVGKVSSGKSLISERLIKFSFFGQMISGTADLVFEGDDEIIVWDFKTGQRDETSEEAYWFQLMCYGYAYANLKQFTPEKMIPLSLVYVDQQKIITRAMSLSEMSSLLFENWSKTESLNQVNLNHCLKCEYSSICCHYKSSAP